MSSHLISRDDRLAAIESILFHSPQGVRVVEIANACQVDRRTIYRDMAKLRADGVPIYQMDGRFFMSKEYYAASVQLNIHEMFALFTAVRIFSQSDAQQNPHLISALAKLNAGLPRPLAIHVHEIESVMRKHSIDRLFVSVLDVMIRAWRSLHYIRIWHRDLPEGMVFAPYFLDINRHGVLYAVGRLREDTPQAIQAFRLDRILRVELMTDTFEIADDFNAASYLANPLGIWGDTGTVRVVLALWGDAERNQRKHDWMSRANAVVKDDGRTYVTLFVWDWRDVLPFVRSMGTDVEVIEPASMRERLTEEFRRAIELYTDSIPQEIE